MSEKTIRKCDDRGNVIYIKYSNGHEYWWTFNKNNKVIYFKDYTGYEAWIEYDENNNEIHRRDTGGIERWYKYDEEDRIIYQNDGKNKIWCKYDEKGEIINISKEEYDKIEYDKRGPISRFELMDL